MQCVIDRIDGRNGECTPGIFQQSCMGQMFDFAAANKQDSRYRFRRDAGVATVKGDLYASAHGAVNDAVSATARLSRMRFFAYIE